jgi:carbonic anhydrase
LFRAVGAAAISSVAIGGLLTTGRVEAAALTLAQRDALTPDDALALLLAGNARFRAGKMQQHDYLAQKRSSVAGQYPATVVLSCIDSRAPAEIVFDAGIGDVFNTRVAGNVISDDVLGSMEFACQIAGARLIMVMGHTSCGAIKGAIDGADMGYLTALVNKIRPAAEATHYDGERSSSNPAFVDEVARTHVRMTLARIRQSSSVLAALERKGEIRMVGGLYHLVGGEVEVLV